MNLPLPLRIAWRHLRAERPPRWSRPVAAAAAVFAALGGLALVWSSRAPAEPFSATLPLADVVGLVGVLVLGVGVLVLGFALTVRRFTLLVAITGYSVAQGCAALVIVLSLLGGLEGDLQRRLLGHRAHLRIAPPPGAEIVAPDPLVARVRAVDGVLGVSPALEGPIMIRSGFGRAGVNLVGVDPVRHAEASGLPDEVIEGDYRAFVDPSLLPRRPFPGREGPEPPEPPSSPEGPGPAEHVQEDSTGGDPGPTDVVDEVEDDEGDEGGWEDPEVEIPRLRAEGTIPAARPPVVVEASAAPEPGPAPEPELAPEPEPAPPPVVIPVLLGVELANELSVVAGDPVQLITPEGRMTPAGLVPGVLAARVAGVFATGVYDDDRDFAYIPLRDAQAFLRAPDAVTSISVRLRDPRALADARAAVVAVAGAPFVVEDWRQIHRGLFAAMFIEKVAMFIALLFVILVAAFGILATNMMSVMERSAEIAILKAMGARDRLALQVFALEGMIVGALGCVGGVGAGLALCAWFGERGVPLRSDAFTLEALPLRTDPWEVALVAAAALLLVGLASVLPARAAAVLRPVDGLRRGE